MDSKLPLRSTCAEQIYKDMFTPTYCQCFVLQSQALPTSSAIGPYFLASVPSQAYQAPICFTCDGVTDINRKGMTFFEIIMEKGNPSISCHANIYSEYRTNTFFMTAYLTHQSPMTHKYCDVLYGSDVNILFLRWCYVCYILRHFIIYLQSEVF